MKSNKLIKSYTNNPSRLYLLDGAGALLSAFMLGVVLVALQQIVGIPIWSLLLLAAIPCCFVVYDTYYYLKKSDKGRPLRIISLLNLAYCCLSIALAVKHIETLTRWGWLYIIIECIIILLVARLEWLVAREADDIRNKFQDDM